MIKLHSEYSLLEGVGSIKEYIAKAKSLNVDTLALVDNAMFASIDFFENCKKNNIKAIIGLDVYIKGIKSNDYHILSIYSKNYNSLKNIYKLSTISFTKKIKDINVVEIEDILNCGDDIYILSGGIKSEFMYHFLNKEYELAKEVLFSLSKHFGDKFYFEMPLFDITLDEKEALVKIYNEVKLKTLAINEVYYTNKEDKILQKIFTAIKTNKTITEVKDDIKRDGFYFKSKEEIKNIYPENIMEEIEKNLSYFKNSININMEFENVEFPSVDIPNNISERAYIESLIEDKIHIKYPNNLEKAKKRVKYELDIIENMGYIKYFLIVYDFIKFAKNNNIYVGPGRGSAAGSIVSYLLDITEVDPLKYGLIFERFLNPQRISMPDIDIDIEQERRMEVIEYIKNKYSINNVSQILTFSTFKPALAIKDVARVLEIPEKSIESYIKKVNKNGLDSISEDKKNIKLLIDYAKRIENKPKNMSTHAAGIIITKENMYDNLPLIYNEYTKDYQIQYVANVLESLGYLKIDILGLKNLNIIKSTIERANLNLDIYNLEEDEEVFKLFNDGEMLGIFQSESDGIRSLAMKLKINSLEDIALLLALYRPGPLESGYIPNLIETKNKNKKISYIHPSLEKILMPTYGVLVYQEQIMQIAREISGYSLSEADELRKAIGKKNQELLEKNREIFISRATIPKNIASKIYDLIEKFGNYGFNKAHAISYAKITYQTIYLKHKFKKEFYASVLSSELKDEKKLLKAYLELRKSKIDILYPSINKSTNRYEVLDNNILMPLSAAKSMSEKSAKDILKEREKNGEFKNIFDLLNRVPSLNKSNIEGLIYSGSLDEFKYNRKTLINNLEEIIKWNSKKKKLKEDIFSNLFLGIKNEIDDFKFKKEEEYSFNELINFEKEYLKFSKKSYEELDKSILARVFKNEENIKIGYINNIKNKITKNSELMSNVIITTNEGIEEYLVFPKILYQYSNLLVENTLILYESKTLDDNKKMINKVYSINNLENCMLNLRINENFDKKEELKNIIKENKGENLLTIYLLEKNKYKQQILNKKYSIKISEEVLNEISNILGEENVRISFFEKS